MTQTSREFYQNQIEELEVKEESIEDILGNIDFSTMPGGEGELTVLQEARLKKILKETDYLDQKILNKKEQLFSEWSEKFFTVFSKSFSKFKNSLIDLHLSDTQVDKLNQNLEYAVKNLEAGLSEIKQDYINDIDSDEYEY